ncbi:MAG: viroplasmin family protein [Marinilabiliaceae bacterium]|nr:viroplasmin family protein [Marinilabiliaceae bacterium]
MAKSKKWYVVWRGNTPGVYDDWSVAKSQITHFSNARYKGYPSEQEAKEAFVAGPPALPAYLTSSKKKELSSLAPSVKPLTRAIAVDAACAGNPGLMEYRGVSLWDKKELFHKKFELGTNNIGEFLAIVHCMAMLKNNNIEDVAIYSDSMTAQGWVNKGKCRTKLITTPQTAELLSLVKRAETWLQNNPTRPLLLKWPTEAWGEIPADFGRKHK